MGRFTLDNRGLVKEWRDYFDIPGSERQLAATK
jgi:limonene-1,2-epoxide hydrolase